MKGPFHTSDKIKKFTGSPQFTAACEAVGITPSRRQYKKWRRGEGLAIQYHRANNG